MTIKEGVAVSIQALSKQFDARPVLRGINLEVRPGELVTIVGRSGCGKSTLLRILCGLDTPSAGRVQIGGATPDASADVRVVFQEPRLLPWRSVLQNVCVGLPRLDQAFGRAVLQQVGLGERAHDYPAVLSGGQRQRVALARALVHEPQLMLLDEPFGALDALTRIGMQSLVESLWQLHRFTALLVTHDVEEAVLLADRVLVIDDGRVVTELAVDIPRPRSRAQPEVGRLAAQLLDAIFARAPSDERPTAPEPRAAIASSGLAPSYTWPAERHS